MNLSRNEILKHASNADVYRRGFKYYNDNRTLFLECEDLRGGQKSIRSLVHGDFRDYEVSVEFKNGEIDQYKCSCESHVMWRGACKHVVCALLSYYDEVQNEVKRKEEAKPAGYILDKTEDILLNKFTETSQKNKVKLLPCFYVDENGKNYLSLTIGRNKMYVVKNIVELMDNIKNNAVFSYGKELKFSHYIHEFDPISVKLIHFIMKYLSYRNDGESKNYYRTEEVRYLLLTEYAVDEFFAIYLNDRVECDIFGAEISGGYVTRNIPAIQFQVDMDIQRLSAYIKAINFSHYILQGGEKEYILTDGFIYVLEKDSFLGILLTGNAEAMEKGILFEGADFSKFVSTVMPLMIEQNYIGNSSQICEVFKAESLKTEIYLDSESKDITAKIIFKYGDEEVLYNSKKVYSIIRDPKQERKIISLLELWGFKPSGLNLLALSGDDAIYEFLSEGLEEIKAYADIFVTGSFSKKALNAQNKYALGYKIKGGLLEIEIDSSDYTLDELYEAITAYHLKRRYYRFKDGSIVDLEDREISALADIVASLDIGKKEFSEGKIKVPKFRAIYAENRLDGYNIKYSASKELEKMKQLFVQGVNKKGEIPQCIKDILRNYQKEGLLWMQTLYDYGFGGILADDMGLGKTLQSIGLMLNNRAKAKYPDLVVAPTSLVYNWEKEIHKFAPELQCTVVSGSPDTREQILKSSKPDVFITTYEMLKRDIELYKKKKFNILFADEAQNIKNPTTKNAKALKLLEAQNRFALTGTPIENSLSELWSIFDFIMPGYLYSHTKFAKNYELPILKENDNQVSEKLRMQTAPFVMRRLKKDVLSELPEKTESVLYAEMTEEQHKIYTAYLLKAKGMLGIENDGFSLKNKKIDILAQLTRLRQICCHPALFMENYTGGSGKLDAALETIVNAVASGHRILVFSQFTSMLNVISGELGKAGIEYFYLDGSVPSQKRTEMAEAFNGGEKDVFLISLKAGGTGLNLVGADVVIHFDQWWNPAVMSQASDRAYRIGQNRAVQIINIVAKESIEDKILELQMKKKDLVERVIENTSPMSLNLTEDDIKMLFM